MGVIDTYQRRYRTANPEEVALVNFWLFNSYLIPVSLNGWRVFVSRHLFAKFELQAQESCVPSLKVISRNTWKHPVTIHSLVRRGALFFKR